MSSVSSADSRLAERPLVRIAEELDPLRSNDRVRPGRYRKVETDRLVPDQSSLIEECLLERACLNASPEDAAALASAAMKSRRLISAPKDDKTASYRTI